MDELSSTDLYCERLSVVWVFDVFTMLEMTFVESIIESVLSEITYVIEECMLEEGDVLTCKYFEDIAEDNNVGSAEIKLDVLDTLFKSVLTVLEFCELKTFEFDLKLNVNGDDLVGLFKKEVNTVTVSSECVLIDLPEYILPDISLDDANKFELVDNSGVLIVDKVCIETEFELIISSIM